MQCTEVHNGTQSTTESDLDSWVEWLKQFWTVFSGQWWDVREGERRGARV